MDYDYVQTEKAKAMMRYRRIQSVARIWRLFEFAVALALLSWSSTRFPIVLQFAGHCARRLSEYLFSPHINFVLGNAIIVVVVLLSRHSNSGERTDDDRSYNYCVPTTVSNEVEEEPTVPVPVSIPTPATEKVERLLPESAEKQIVPVENVASPTQIDEVSLAINQATKQIKRFQRSQSAKLRRDLRGESPRPELRRSETVRAVTSFEAVDELSNEEFRRTIESFIANQQKFLWAQKMEERSYQKC